MSKVIRTPAILLRSVNYGEADRIVTWLTRDFGKVSAYARGARKSRKRFAGAMEPFCIVDTEMRPPRTELATLTQARVTQSYLGILGSIDKMETAGAALRFVSQTTEHHLADIHAFETTTEMLETIDRATTSCEHLLLTFKVRLMSLTGYRPSFDTCQPCGRRAPEGKRAYFDPKQGSLICSECGEHRGVSLSAQTRQILRAAITSPALQPAPWPVLQLAEAKVAVEEFVRQHLE